MARIIIIALIVAVAGGISLTLLGPWPTGIILGLALIGYLTGISSIHSKIKSNERPHSLVGYYGSYVALWTGIPAFVMLLIWLFAQQTVIEVLLFESLPSEGIHNGVAVAELEEQDRELLISEIEQVAGGLIFTEPTPMVEEAAARYNRWQEIAKWSMRGVVAAIGLLGLAFAWSRIAPKFRAREGVEAIVVGFMVLCSTIAILTTVGIVGSLIFEAVRFFERVPIWEFLFGLNWEPQIAIRPDQVAGLGAFGAIPVFAGTFLISFIAVLVAAVIGMPAAMYLAEFASERVRYTIKPFLEILAGVPTIVYGFFAVLVVTPALRYVFGDLIGFDVSANLALSAGLVMGIMLIPFVSSLSDDAISAVPQAMRDGAIALGATRAETMTQVLLPAALPGIVGGFLLAVSRAIGETMIVVMAAGIIATLTINPLDSVTTVTVQIVTLLIGDTEFDNPKTLSAFGLGLLLFVLTLGLNIFALRIVQKYREQYD